MKHSPSILPSIVLALILAAVIWVAAGVFNDAREGFCAQLEPCHTEETGR